MLDRQTVTLTEIKTTSPALAELMRLCFLRAGLSRAEGLSAFVLGNPKAWLGSTSHEVISKISGADLTVETVNVAFERLWDQAISVRESNASCHPLNQRFGAPSNWPGYHLIRASARLRAQEIVAGQPGSVRRDTPDDESSAPYEVRERKFMACSGKLVGRPDVVRGNTIIDYKSGQIFDEDKNGQTSSVKAAYLRQLRIYAYLVRQTLGKWPRFGVIMPLAGKGVKIELYPVECEQEAREAIEFLDKYNEIVQDRQDPSTLASPSSGVCNWCSYKIVCSAFWQNAGVQWPKMADGAAVEGTVIGYPQPVHGGAACSLSMDVHAGTEGRCQVNLTTLNLSVHSSLSTVSAGERIRLTGLRIRKDGALSPTQRTIVIPEREIPPLQLTRRKKESLWIPSS